MTKLSFLDKIKILINTSINNKFFLIILIFLLFIGYILFSTNKKNKKTSKTIFISIYIFITLFIIIAFNNSLGHLVDYFMNNLFIAIYFPNLAIYTCALIITNVIIWISVFNFKTTKFIKNINIIIYCIINYILILILNIITSKNLDIYSTASVYNNKQALGLIELSSTIFILWIIFLIIYKIILIYLKKDYKPKIKKVIVKKEVHTLPNRVTTTVAPSQVKTKAKSIKPENNNLISEYEKLLSLDDYKVLLKILKEHQEKERLAQEQKALKEKELTIFRELENMYKN